MKRNFVSLLLFALFICMASALLYTRADPVSVAAQETTTPDATMQSLFERLKARMEDEPAFTINVWFNNPPVAGEPAWEIPSALDGGGSRRLGEIGADYVCFVEQGQTFNDSVCIPYTNIRMLTYANEP
jgi:hypothetical protein